MGDNIIFTMSQPVFMGTIPLREEIGIHGETLHCKDKRCKKKSICQRFNPKYNKDFLRDSLQLLNNELCGYFKPVVYQPTYDKIEIKIPFKNLKIQSKV